MNQSIFRWERDFTKTVVRLALPIMMQALFSALMHILDNLMIGMYGGGQGVELAGVTQANQVTFLMQIVMFGMVSGSAILMSQFWGKRDIGGIRHTMIVAQITAAFVAIAFAVAAIAMPETIMSWLLKSDPAAQAAGVEYLRIIALVYLLDGVLFVQESVLKSTEHVNLPTIAGIVAILTNTLLNWVLIFGHLGFPEMGVRGAALATVIGVALQLAVLMIVSYRRNYANAIKLSEIKLPSRDIVRRYFFTVLPVLLNESLWSLGIVFIRSAYGQMHVDAVAAMSIFGNVEQLAFVTLRGMTTACSILIGKAIGADNPDVAQLMAKRFVIGSMAMAVVTGAMVAVFGGLIVQPFKVTEEAKHAARQIILFYSSLIWLSAACNTLIVGVMRAGGDVIFSGVIDVAFLWAVSVPLVWLAGPGLGWPVQYVYLIAQVELVLKTLLGAQRLKSRKWMHNLVEDVG